MLHRKDYKAIAGIIRQSYQDEPTQSGRGAVIQLAGSFANMLANDNPLFDRERFMTACGIIK